MTGHVYRNEDATPIAGVLITATVQTKTAAEAVVILTFPNTAAGDPDIVTDQTGFYRIVGVPTDSVIESIKHDINNRNPGSEQKFSPKFNNVVNKVLSQPSDSFSFEALVTVFGNYKRELLIGLGNGRAVEDLRNQFGTTDADSFRVTNGNARERELIREQREAWLEAFGLNPPCPPLVIAEPSEHRGLKGRLRLFRK